MVCRHSVVCRYIVGALQRFEEASVERLHLMGAVWRKSDQLDSMSPGIVYSIQGLVAVMHVQHNPVTVLR